MAINVSNAGFDLNKLPLDQITYATLIKGYEQLGLIDDLLKNKVPSYDSRYAQYTAKFYMYIPHNFGRQKMSNFIINDE